MGVAVSTGRSASCPAQENVPPSCVPAQPRPSPVLAPPPAPCSRTSVLGGPCHQTPWGTESCLLLLLLALEHLETTHAGSGASPVMGAHIVSNKQDAELFPINGLLTVATEAIEKPHRPQRKLFHAYTPTADEFRELGVCIKRVKTANSVEWTRH